MGKINDKMRKSRAGINDDSNDISRDESYTTQNIGAQIISDDIPVRHEHKHDWTFVKEIERRNEWGTIKATYSKYVCYCGGVKKTEQFEVEE